MKADPVTTAESDRILSLHEAGHSLRTVAARVGRCYNTVWRVVNAAGGIRKRNLVTPAERQRMADWWLAQPSERQSIAAVAREFGRSHACTRRNLVVAGVIEIGG